MAVGRRQSETRGLGVIAVRLSDLQIEYFEAFREARPLKARWVRIRGYWSFWLWVMKWSSGLLKPNVPTHRLRTERETIPPSLRLRNASTSSD